MREVGMRGEPILQCGKTRYYACLDDDLFLLLDPLCPDAVKSLLEHRDFDTEHLNRLL